MITVLHKNNCLGVKLMMVFERYGIVTIRTDFQQGMELVS